MSEESITVLANHGNTDPAKGLFIQYSKTILYIRTFPTTRATNTSTQASATTSSITYNNRDVKIKK